MPALGAAGFEPGFEPAGLKSFLPFGFETFPGI